MRMKELFLSVVKRAEEKYDFRLENLCVMGNHFYFILKPVHRENLSAIVRWIMSVFAMTYNRINGISGHVWGCRFFSRIIENLRALMQVNEYIDAYPVRYNPVRASQIEGRKQWRCGGLWFHRTGNAEVIVARALLFAWKRAQFFLYCKSQS
jgi:putative transposase